MKYSERKTVTDFLKAHDPTFISIAGMAGYNSAVHNAMKAAFLLGCNAAFTLSEKAFEQGDFYKRIEDLVAETNDISDKISHNW